MSKLIMVKDVGTAVRIYYSCPELGTKEIMELFSCSHATAAKLKAPARELQNERGILTFEVKAHENKEDHRHLSRCCSCSHYAHRLSRQRGLSRAARLQIHPGIHNRRNRDPSRLDRRRLQTLPLHSFRIPPGTIRDTVQYHLRGRRSPRMLEDRQRERLPNLSRGERSDYHKINQILISGALRARRPSPSAEHRRPFPSFVDHRFLHLFCITLL